MNFTFINFSCFVIYKKLLNKRKNEKIINIQTLNVNIFSNA